MYKEETPQLDHAIVTLRPKGPVVISGNFITIDEDGNEIERRERLSICRCGLSQKLPYCDGAHKAVMNR